MNVARLETYVMTSQKGSGIICLNGAATRLVKRGDIIIVMSFVHLDKQAGYQMKSKVAILNEDNTIAELLEQD